MLGSNSLMSGSHALRNAPYSLFLRSYRRWERKAILKFIIQNNSVITRNRMQALELLPSLIPYFVFGKCSSLPNKLFQEVIRALILAIDEGKPLVITISKLVGVKPSSVRHVFWVNAEILGGDVFTAIYNIDRVSPEYRPISAVEWRVFTELFACAKAFAAFQSNTKRYWSTADSGLVKLNEFVSSRNLETNRLIELSKGQLGRTRKRIISSFYGWPNGNEIEVFKDDLWQYLTLEGNLRGYNHKLSSQVALVLTNHYCTQFSFIRQLEVSAQLRKSQLAHEFSQTPNKIWPALFDSPIAFGKLKAVCLSTSNELVSEGRIAQHCVGGYTPLCLYNGLHIISIRDDLENTISTISLVIKQMNRNFVPVLLEHYAKGNTPPTEDCMRFQKDLFQYITTQEMQQRLLLLQGEMGGLPPAIRQNQDDAEDMRKLFKCSLPKYDELLFELEQKLYDMESIFMLREFEKDSAYNALVQGAGSTDDDNTMIFSMCNNKWPYGSSYLDYWC